MTRPRILVIGPTPPPYMGPAVNTQALISHPALHAAFEVLHLDTSDRRDITNSARLDVTNVVLALRHGAQFAKILARDSPDLIYLPISPSRLGLLRDLQFLVPAALARKALVIHQRGGEMKKLYRASDPAVRAALRFVFSRVARVVVLGDYFRPDFDELVDPRRVAVVYNGTDPSALLLAERPHQRERARVLFMGILRQEKGYRHVLEAARRLRDKPITFQLAGEFMTGEDRRFTEAFIRDHSLADTVELLGVVSGDAKVALLSTADIFAFPTEYQWEGHPTVLVEAMAAGLPIISTRHVAIPETIADGASGILIDRGDVDSLTSAIDRLASDRALRERLGGQARATMLDRFTLDRCVQGLVTVFGQALEDRP